MNSMLKSLAKKAIVYLQEISPELATKILFKKYLGYTLNMNNHVTLNEKMQWLKLKVYQNNELVCKCVDKYRVREFVKEKGRSDLLVKLIGVWDSPDEINFSVLPNKFVLKCNHGSGSVIVCKNKEDLDQEKVKKQLKEWMSEDYGLQRAELSYKGVEKKIICEDLIETEDGNPPKDYKIFCNYGVPKFLFVASERHGDDAYFDFYDLNWNHYDVQNDHLNSPKGNMKPNRLQDMLKAASDLSKEFPLVRVDLYFENNRIYFGELTFLHFGGLHKFTPEKYDEFFGNMIEFGHLVKTGRTKNV